MPSSTSHVGTEIVRDACIKFPNTPHLTLARILNKKHPGVWGSLSAVRMAVCYMRGARPAGKSGYNKNPVPFSCPQIRYNPHALPKSDESNWSPYVVELGGDERALVLSDIHVPYHSMQALTVALEYGKRYSPSIVILNGDTADFYRLSRFCKDPRKRSLKGEVQAIRQLIEHIEGLFPKARKIWKDGNHDERYWICAANAAPELVEAGAIRSIPELLGLDFFCWEYVTDKRPIILGKLNILHGHEYPGGIAAPVNPARGLFLRAKECALQGHQHQTSEHTETTISGRQVATWSTGCLCELHPAYMPLNKWGHGLATVDVSRNGNFLVCNKKIIDGAVY